MAGGKRISRGDDERYAAYGNRLLSEWGRFAAKKTDCGLGYPCISPMFKDRVKGRGGRPLIPGWLFLVDAMLAGLRVSEPDIFLSVFYHYVKNAPMSACARWMGLPEAAVFRKIAKARALAVRCVMDKNI